MRLKQIKLVGFKSFVDPTVLHLNAQLIGIVGPNGCGKSNIIDAVRWVLGESSAKDLRGESMLDVIFNGSTLRKPVGRAAIELLFDNLDGKLNREYANFTEVSIRREIDRDRQSEYYLNDKKCRKRDITDLFAGTGLLQNGYAIIGQGTVSKIIESKPEDLRSFIEEAADISIYKKRRHETELRMGHTEENLNRLQDILLEQTRLLEKLEKQSATAEKYQQYQAQKQDLEIKLITVKAHHFNQNLIHYNKEINQISIELEKHLSEKTNIISQLELQKTSHSEKFDYFSTVKEEYYKLSTNIARLEQTLQHKKEQQAKYKEDLSLVNVELSKISQQYADDQQLQGSLDNDLKLVEQTYTELASKKDYAEKNYLAVQADMQNLHATLNKLQLKLQGSQNNTEKTKFSIEQIENLSKELCFRIEKLQQENVNYDQDGLYTEILLLEKQLRNEENVLQDRHKELLQIAEIAKEKKGSIKSLLEHKNNLQSNIHKIQGTIGSVQALQKSALEINSLKLDWLVKTNIVQDSLFFNKLVIEDGWEIAVGVVLNQYLDAILLSDGINKLSTDVWRSIKDFRVVLIEETALSSEWQNGKSVTDEHENGKVSILSKIKEKFSFEHLFKNIYIADDLAFALEYRKNLLPHQSFITKNGELIGFDWLIIDKIDTKQKILLRNKELKKLQADLQNLGSELQNLNLQIDVAEQELIDIEKNQAIIIDHNKKEESQIRTIIIDVTSKKSKLESIKARSEKITTEIKEYHAKISDLTIKEKSLRSNLSVEIEEMSNLSEQEKIFSEQKINLQEILNSSMEHNKLAIKDFHAIALQKQQLVTKNHALDEAKQRLSSQIQLLENRKSKLQMELQANNGPVQPIELELDALLNDKLDQEEDLHKAKSALDEVEEYIKQLDNQNNNLNNTVEQLRSKLGSLKLEQNAVSTRLADLMETVKDNNSINLTDTIEDLNQDLNIDLWQEKSDAVTKSINKLGAVNLAAIEEFNAESERKNYLDLQVNDLTTALATLKDAIFKIDNETKKKFQATFEQINNNFQQLFPKLFGGGGAYLELNTNDLLSSGVSVFAHPPGKKNSTIYLLSGGEKALTAVALIFAIFQLNPAPFCILDEVDAPLDDANVTRFGDLLISMSHQVQFIFISHNKTTMKIANQLTGVTMKEPGVSRLVSVNIDEAVEMVN